MLLNFAAATALLLASGVVSPVAVTTYNPSCGTNAVCARQGRFFKMSQCGWKIRDVMLTQGNAAAIAYAGRATDAAIAFGADYGFTVTKSLILPKIGTISGSSTKAGAATALALLQVSKKIGDECWFDATTTTCTGYIAEADSHVRTLAGVVGSGSGFYCMSNPPTSNSNWNCDTIIAPQVTGTCAP